MNELVPRTGVLSEAFPAILQRRVTLGLADHFLPHYLALSRRPASMVRRMARISGSL